MALERAKKELTLAQLAELERKDPEFGRMMRRHRRFHGSNPDSFETVELPGVKATFKYATALGHTRAHEYEVPRSSGRGNGPPYRHAFDRGRTFTITDPDGKGVYLAKRRGSKLRVTDRGIIG